MRYFRLTDVLSIPGRWHLGEVTYADGSEPMLREGLKLEYSAPLEVEIQEPGRILDFSLTSFAVPVARTALARTRLQCSPELTCSAFLCTSSEHQGCSRSTLCG